MQCCDVKAMTQCCDAKAMMQQQSMTSLDSVKAVIVFQQYTCLSVHMRVVHQSWLGLCQPVRVTQVLFGFKKRSLITQFSSLNFHHPSLITQFLSFITHHSSLKTPHPVWHQHSLVITQYFSTIYGPHTCTLCSFYSFFFSFNLQYPNSLNLVRKKKKKELKTEPVKKKKLGQKVRLQVPPCVFN